MVEVASQCVYFIEEGKSMEMKGTQPPKERVTQGRFQGNCLELENLQSSYAVGPV